MSACRIKCVEPLHSVYIIIDGEYVAYARFRCTGYPSFYLLITHLCIHFHSINTDKMQLLLYGMIKQRPFQTGWYMDMATKDPVNFLFVATTSRLFQGIQLYSCQCYPGSVYFTV
jgi:hypothetical protein